MNLRSLISLPWTALLVAIAPVSCHKPPADRVQGYVEGEFVHVAAPFGGQLEELTVERGDEVTAGAPLFKLEAVAETATRNEAAYRVSQAQATLDDVGKGRRNSEIEAFQAELDAAKAALAYSTGELKRQEMGHRKGAVADRELDAAKALHDRDEQQVRQLEATLVTARLGAREDLIAVARHGLEAAQAALTGAEWKLSQKSQNSPLTARVTDVVFRKGDFVTPGTPVVVLLPPANVKVRAFVPQRLLASVQVGATARVWIDGAAEAVDATVVYIAPRAEYTPPVIFSQQMREKFVFLVELKVVPEVAATLHPGQPVDVEFSGADP